MYERSFVIFNSEVVKFFVFVCGSLIVKQIYCFEAVFITHYYTHLYSCEKSKSGLGQFFFFLCVTAFSHCFELIHTHYEHISIWNEGGA